MRAAATLACIWLALQAGAVLAKAAGGPPPPAEELIASAGLDGARVGYLAIDLNRDVVLAARRADEAFLPASTAKIATAIAALEILGGGHRFETVLRLSGDRLYLVGGGDPLLAVEDLMSLARAGVEAGLAQARFFYDDSLLARATAINDGQSGRAVYNPGVAALSLSFNRRRLIWRGRMGGGLEAFALPGGDLAPLTTALARGQPVVRRVETPGGPAWHVSGRGEGRTWVPVARPARFAAALFRDLAAMQGLALGEPKAGTAPANARTVARHRGQRLVDIVGLALHYSNNMVAELVGLGAAREARRQAGGAGGLGRPAAGRSGPAPRRRCRSGLAA